MPELLAADREREQVGERARAAVANLIVPQIEHANRARALKRDGQRARAGVRDAIVREIEGLERVLGGERVGGLRARLGLRAQRQNMSESRPDHSELNN